MFFANDNNPGLFEFMNNHCPVSDKLELKIGAQVMLTKNMDVQRGLVNGARGVVIGFEGKKESKHKCFLHFLFYFFFLIYFIF